MDQDFKLILRPRVAIVIAYGANFNPHSKLDLVNKHLCGSVPVCMSGIYFFSPRTEQLIKERIPSEYF